MGTSIVKFSATPASAPQWAVLRGQTLHPLAMKVGHHRELMQVYFDDRAEFDRAISAEGLAAGDVTLHAPLSKNIQLFCQGLNYADHRAEGGMSAGGEEEENLLFMKAGSTICGPNETIVRPRGCQLLDYEIELGIVLKTDLPEASTVTDANLGDYIGGLFLCNDVSARDIMFGAPMLQWFKGKTQRTFCPSGPVLYLVDEGDLDQLYKLELKLWMNGELKQHAVTDLLIHKPPKTLSELSVFTDVNAGDCVLTGTPGGVLAGADVKTGLAILLNFKNDAKRRKKFTDAQLAKTRFLAPGDLLELELKSLDGSIDLGRQRNEIADA